AAQVAGGRLVIEGADICYHKRFVPRRARAGSRTRNIGGPMKTQYGMIVLALCVAATASAQSKNLSQNPVPLATEAGFQTGSGTGSKDVPHPYMLWTKEEAAAIRKRIETDPAAKQQLERMVAVESSRGGYPSLFNLFKFSVLGDEKAGETEKKALLGFVGRRPPQGKPGEAVYLPSLYFGLGPVDSGKVKPPPAPSYVAPERGFAMLRMEEGPAYWESGRPAATLQFGSYYVHYVYDCFALLQYVAHNRYIYQRMANTRGGYAGGDPWRDHVRGQAGGIVVDGLQAKYVDSGEEGIKHQRLRRHFA
ncbi:MAG: hypothetical protein ABSH20_32280, partial [Tepidisphaeraceae bacterium]